jgi:hypothetical protein
LAINAANASYMTVMYISTLKRVDNEEEMNTHDLQRSERECKVNPRMKRNI